ncbi:TIGR02679 domain-containing protein [Prauserella endophytica]|uniref:DUF2399 domain-containing protein n=1 Tax=Prauserella endophytica TaxID=1592324 RepID=A0ABY2RT19_9PSEU|nr:TIGR02679 domain-containing protein [Prauserella endophytica]TKG59279.1 DUF2399 domain-containing protein [Prauserella endophytica]
MNTDDTPTGTINQSDTAAAHTQLLNWAAKAGPAKIITALRKHLEDGHSWGKTTLPVELTEEERRQVRALLGTAWDASGRGITPHIFKTKMLKLGIDTATAVRLLYGDELINRREQRREHRANASAERQQALTVLLDAGIHPTSAEAWMRRKGLPPTGRGQLLALTRSIAAAWQHLPHGTDTIMLSVLADAALDDPHALDRRAGRIGLDILRLADGDGHEDADYDGDGWRTAWEALGVICDPLSSRVLALNLPLTGSAPACAITAAANQTGEPVWLTWRSLNGDFALDHNQRGPDPRVDVYVCENPTVVAAAADTLASRSYPLICTNGVPSGAVRKLLAGLAATGTHLHIRADDDTTGQAIVAQLMATLPHASLWRYQQRPAETVNNNPEYEERVLNTLLMDLANTN